MKIMILECKRMVNRIILLGFLAFVLIFSVYDSQRNLDRYNAVSYTHLRAHETSV